MNFILRDLLDIYIIKPFKKFGVVAKMMRMSFKRTMVKNNPDDYLIMLHVLNYCEHVYKPNECETRQIVTPHVYPPAANSAQNAIPHKICKHALIKNKIKII